MNKSIFLLLFSISILSCNTEVITQPVGTVTKDTVKIKDKLIFSKKTFSEFRDSFGNYVGDGYAYRPNPINCIEGFQLSILNTLDEEISIFVNDKLVLKKVTQNGLPFLVNTSNNNYLTFSLDDYLNYGSNSIKYQVFNKVGAYSWNIRLFKNISATIGFTTLARPATTSDLIDDSFISNDGSKENQLVLDKTVNVDISCQANNDTEPFITETDYYPHGKNVAYNSYTFSAKGVNSCNKQ